jgi:hypothetical protein
MSEPTQFYGLDGWESLEPDLESALTRILEDAVAVVDEPFDVATKDFKWPIKIDVYRLMKVDKHSKVLVDRVLEMTLEPLDEEYGDPGGDSTEPTPEMRAAAEAFVQVVLDQYTPWACETTGEVIEITREEAEKHYNALP